MPSASRLYGLISRVFLVLFWCISGIFLVNFWCFSDAFYVAETFLEPLQNQTWCLVTAFLSGALLLPAGSTKKPTTTKQPFKDTLDLQKADANCCSQLTIQERIKLQNTSEVGKFTSRERANRFSALKKLLY